MGGNVHPDRLALWRAARPEGDGRYRDGQHRGSDLGAVDPVGGSRGERTVARARRRLMPYSGNPTVANFKTDMKNLTAQMQGSLEENFGRQADELMENM